MTMRPGNKGLTVAINLWPSKKDFNAERARLRIKGQATNAHTRKVAKFNDAGELISILGKWNVEKLKQIKAATR